MTLLQCTNRLLSFCLLLQYLQSSSLNSSSQLRNTIHSSLISSLRKSISPVLITTGSCSYQQPDNHLIKHLVLQTYTREQPKTTSPGAQQAHQFIVGGLGGERVTGHPFIGRGGDTDLDQLKGGSRLSQWQWSQQGFVHNFVDKQIHSLVYSLPRGYLRLG